MACMAQYFSEKNRDPIGARVEGQNPTRPGLHETEGHYLLLGLQQPQVGYAWGKSLGIGGGRVEIGERTRPFLSRRPYGTGRCL